MLSLRWFSRNNNNNNIPTTPTTGGDVSSRYQFIKKLADTLQGEIYLAKNTITNQYVIIKIAIKYCVKNKVSKSNNPIPEDFKNEHRLHRGVTEFLKNDMKSGKINPNAMIGFVTCEHYFKDNNNYYLVIQHCKDGDLFEYVCNYHKSHLQNKNTNNTKTKTNNPDNNDNNNNNNSHHIQEWIGNVRHMFKQLVFAVAFLHGYRIVHQDLSLENTMLFDLDSLYVKIIDFGVAKQNPKAKSKGRVGKTNYMSPECYENKDYDPYANDVWCLGVMLFMMLIGAPPPIRDKVALQYITGGYLKHLLQKWKRLHLVDNCSIDCLSRILTWEAQRITLDDLLQHPFISISRPFYPVMEKIKNSQRFIQEWNGLDKSTLTREILREKLTKAEAIMNGLMASRAQMKNRKKEKEKQKEEKLKEEKQQKGQEKNSNSNKRESPEEQKHPEREEPTNNQIEMLEESGPEEEEKFNKLIEDAITQTKVIVKELKGLVNQDNISS